MRLLGSCELKSDNCSGKVTMHFVKPGRVFLTTRKLTVVAAKKPLSTDTAVYLVLNQKGDKWEPIYTKFDRIDAKRSNYQNIIDECCEFAKTTLENEEIKKTYDSLSAKYIIPMVRPMRACCFSIYEPQGQHLGVFDNEKNSTVKWFHCREEFAKSFHAKTEKMFFCTVSISKGTAKNYNDYRLRSRRVARFIHRLEVKLGLKEFTKFYETNQYNIIEIDPSGFWRADTLKRSLFTILVRAGLLYDQKKDNYKDALRSYTYSAQTNKYITRFLDGYTKFVGKEETGWVNTFVYCDKSAEKVLVKP
jgi:hypothetical protein